MSGTRLVVGVTGATGAIYAQRLLQRARALGAETHLVVTPAGVLNLHHELGLQRHDFEALADRCYAPGDVGACLASGSFDAAAMAIAPCSMKTLAAVAHGFGDNLLTRAADVMLKERRPLVVVPRETPLSVIHLENLTTLARAGAVILPAMPSFYSQPASVEPLLDTVVGRILDQLGLEHDLLKRWGTASPARPAKGESK